MNFRLLGMEPMETFACYDVMKNPDKAVGLHPFKIERMSQAFRNHGQVGLDSLYKLRNQSTEMASNKAFLASAREHGATLKDMMETDRLQLPDRSERGWTPPPKGYTKQLDG